MSLNVKKEKKREDMIVRDFCDLLRCEDEGFGTQEAKMQSHHTEPVRSGCGGKLKKKKAHTRKTKKIQRKCIIVAKTLETNICFVYIYIFCTSV